MGMGFSLIKGSLRCIISQMHHLEFNSGNKLVLNLTFRKLSTILTQKVMPKTEMKSKHEMESKIGLHPS